MPESHRADMKGDDWEPPTGLPDEAQSEDEDAPLGVPPDDEEPDRELPGFPEGDIDTAG